MMDYILIEIINLIISPAFLVLVLIIVALRKAIKFVPQNRAYVVQRFGKFKVVLEAGLNFIVPFIDQVAADRSLKEQAADIPEQSAITKDNISLFVRMKCNVNLDNTVGGNYSNDSQYTMLKTMFENRPHVEFNDITKEMKLTEKVWRIKVKLS